GAHSVLYFSYREYALCLAARGSRDLPNAKLLLRSLAGPPVRGVVRPHNCGAPTPGGIGRPRAAAPALPGQLILWDVCPAAYVPVAVRRRRWCVVCRSCAPNGRSVAALQACD